MSTIAPDKMTVSAREQDVQKQWWVVDAEGQTLGRLATQIASILRGKHKPLYTPHIDGGDFVVVINAEKVGLAEKRIDQKYYLWHSGYPGGQRKRTFKQWNETHPERIIEWAVSGMLPKTRLGKRSLKKLKVYAGSEHPHIAQKPQVLELIKSK